MTGRTIEERRQRHKKISSNHNFFVSFGAYRYITKEEIEASRRLIKRFLKRKAEVEVLVRSFFPRTKKPAEVRMGKGKGKISSFVSVVRPGQLFLRIKGVAKKQAKLAFDALVKKLAFKVNFHYFDNLVEIKRQNRNVRLLVKS